MCRRRPRAAGDPRDRPPQRPRRNGAPNPSTLNSTPKTPSRSGPEVPPENSRLCSSETESLLVRRRWRWCWCLEGSPLAFATGWAVLSSLGQPIVAVPAFLFVEKFARVQVRLDRPRGGT